MPRFTGKWKKNLFSSDAPVTLFTFIFRVEDENVAGLTFQFPA